ncbi:MAG: HAD-IIB family hydrolase [Candidatus Scalindua sp.]|nr:HAD-IIB family hydrolase [Candidatus Scalindua sp.]
MKDKILLFTDLDGTLLDHYTYSYHHADEALALVRKLEVSLVLCSSKTKEEIEIYRKRLSNNEPFISENGGAIYVPKQYKNVYSSRNGFRIKSEIKLSEYNCNQDLVSSKTENQIGFSITEKCNKNDNDYFIIEIGTHYEKLVEAFEKIKRKAGVNIKGFNEFTLDEVVQLTKLSKDEAMLALKREYTLPFVVYGEGEDARIIKEEIALSGLNYTEGAKFMYLMGENDKGKAVRILTDIYKRNYTETDITTVGIGDSLNDLPMLEAVDRPFLVKKVSGNYDERIKVENLVFADGIGPVGWNKAILQLLNEYF